MQTNIDFTTIAQGIINANQDIQGQAYYQDYYYRPRTIVQQAVNINWQADDARLIAVGEENGKNPEVFAIPEGTSELAAGDYGKVYRACKAETLVQLPSSLAMNGTYAPAYRYQLPQQLQKYGHVAKVSANADAIDSLRNEYKILKKLGRYAKYSENPIKAEATLIEEFVEGVTLLKFLENRKLNAQESRLLKQRLAAAVVEMHSKVVIHVDMHSGNIMVNQVGNDFKVTIIDFGSANKKFHCDDINGYQHRTQLAPELISTIGYNETTKQSDAYALGIAFREITARTNYPNLNDRTEAKALDEKLCSITPNNRPTALEAQQVVEGKQTVGSLTKAIPNNNLNQGNVFIPVSPNYPQPPTQLIVQPQVRAIQQPPAPSSYRQIHNATAQAQPQVPQQPQIQAVAQAQQQRIQAQPQSQAVAQVPNNANNNKVEDATKIAKLVAEILDRFNNIYFINSTGVSEMLRIKEDTTKSNADKVADYKKIAQSRPIPQPTRDKLVGWFYTGIVIFNINTLEAVNQELKELENQKLKSGKFF